MSPEPHATHGNGTGAKSPEPRTLHLHGGTAGLAGSLVLHLGPTATIALDAVEPTRFVELATAGPDDPIAVDNLRPLLGTSAEAVAAGRIDTVPPPPADRTDILGRLALLDWVRAALPIPGDELAWHLEALVLVQRLSSPHFRRRAQRHLRTLHEHLRADRSPLLRVPEVARLAKDDDPSIESLEAAVEAARSHLLAAPPPAPLWAVDPPTAGSSFSVDWDRVPQGTLDPAEGSIHVVGRDVEAGAATSTSPRRLVARIVAVDGQIRDEALMEPAKGSFRATFSRPLHSDERVEITGWPQLAARTLDQARTTRRRREAFRALALERRARSMSVSHPKKTVAGATKAHEHRRVQLWLAAASAWRSVGSGPDLVPSHRAEADRLASNAERAVEGTEPGAAGAHQEAFIGELSVPVEAFDGRLRSGGAGHV